MRAKRIDSLPARSGCESGRTPWLVVAALALAIGVALCVLYKPWNRLRYGGASPPLPASTQLETPLADVIHERVQAVLARPYDAMAWGRLGEVYDVHEFFPQAIACYERAQRLAPDEPRWPYWLGIVQRVGNQRAALASFERVLQLAPSWASAHFFAGHGYLSSERLDDAAREFERSLELEPETPAALIGLAKIASLRDDPARALEFLQRALAKAPEAGEARWLAAAACRALGDEAKAQGFAGAGEPPPLQEPYPDQLRAQLIWEEGVTLNFVRERADTLVARGENERAVAELQRYLEKLPKSVEGLVALADVYMRIGKPEEAIARYQAACTLDPTQAAALAQWGLAFARSGKTSEAIPRLRQALALEPSRIEFKSNLGSVLCGSAAPEDREEGLRLLEEVALARADDPLPHVNLAQALRLNGRNEQAIASFERALELVPDDHRLRFEYAVLCAQAGRLDVAVVALERVVEAEPSNLNARLNLIRALTESGRHRDALATLRSACELAPTNVELRAKLAWMLCTSPDEGARSGAEALALARELTRLTEEKNPEFMVIRSAAEAESGDFEAATRTVEQTLDSLRPKPPDVVSDPGLVGIIDQALACRKAYKEGKPFRVGSPP